MVTVCEVGRIHLTAPAAAIAPTTCTMTYRMPATTLVLPVSIAATVMAGLNWPPETRPSIAVTTAYANAVPTTMYARSSP